MAVGKWQYVAKYAQPWHTGVSGSCVIMSVYRLRAHDHGTQACLVAVWKIQYTCLDLARPRHIGVSGARGRHTTCPHRLIDPKRAVADDVESIVLSHVQGKTSSDSRPVTSGQEGEAKQAFFQMMSEWFTQFVRNNPTVSQPSPLVNPPQTSVVPPVMYPNLLNKPPVDKIRKYGAEEFKAWSDDDAEKVEF
ncbi:Leucine-rich repeat-containing 33 [Gossypium australe]|uniref:Leucine-rich repeat-containing 33 n=1 Tax=Gossypium australe TaxID=47621 RepID=A0A5B6VM93_9ROSI|nr:Leucine-rich repeat-containing 33 [Gossypium australe]